METEVKLNALHLPDPTVILRDSWLVNLIRPGSPRRIEMDSRYYDTQDSSLTSRGYALRLRRENRHYFLTLKGDGQAADGLHRREEWSVELTAVEADDFLQQPDGAAAATCLRTSPDPDLPDLPRLLPAERLTETARVTFTRQAADLLFGTALIELALDCGQLSAGSSTMPLCELEAELKQGDAADLLKLGRCLAGRFNLRPENSSKLARCLALRRQHAPDRT